MLNPEKRKAYHAQVVKVEKPRPKTKPSEERPRARPQAAKPNPGMILGLAGAGVVALAALVGGGVWLSSGPSSTGPTVKKDDPAKPVAVAEKKPPVDEAPKTVTLPKTVEEIPEEDAEPDDRAEED